MILTLNPGRMIIFLLKTLMWVAITFTAISGIMFITTNTKENNQMGVRDIRILEKIDNGYLRFKVEDIETSNKFTVIPTRAWYDSIEEGDLSTTKTSLNDTRYGLMTWLFTSFIADIIIASFFVIEFLINLPKMINSVNKKVVLDLRSKKTKQREITLRELEKTPEFQIWKKDYEKVMNTKIKEL